MYTSSVKVCLQDVLMCLEVTYFCSQSLCLHGTCSRVLVLPLWVHRGRSSLWVHAGDGPRSGFTLRMASNNVTGMKEAGKYSLMERKPIHPNRSSLMERKTHPSKPIKPEADVSVSNRFKIVWIP